LFTLGVDSGKEEIVNRLIVPSAGAGYCHFPKHPNDEPCRGYDEEYFKGLTAERRIVKSKNGFPTYMWTKLLSQRNEPFDCRNYALAGVALPMTGIKLETMVRDLYEAPKATEAASSRFGSQGTALIGAPPVAGEPTKFGATNRPMH
jgi:phage terminase large subunit GpA-like protein